MEEKTREILQWNAGQNSYFGPGLVDLQVNGVGGIDFNDPALTEEEVLRATQYLVSRGVTTYFPTVITNSDKNILSLLHTLARACNIYPQVKAAIGGIHLEGPFISPGEGARGAHDPQYIKPPDWELFVQFQQAAEGAVRLVTVAPEWPGAPDFIRRCRENDVLVSMGHSLADTCRIRQAVASGLLLSTHLGNGIPLMLRRHPNMLWDQLSDDRLYAMLITDGHHIPDAFIRVVMKMKAEKVILVSDATRFAGMPPGEYESTIGGTIILDDENRISLKGSGGLLAGAAKDLLEDVETMVNHRLASLEEAWKMASVHVTGMLGSYFPPFKDTRREVVQFCVEKDKIKVKKVFRDERVIYAS